MKKGHDLRAYREKENARLKKFYYANHEKELERGKMRRLRDKEKMAAYQREYYKENRDRILARGTAYIKSNPERRRAYVRGYKKEKYATDPHYRLDVLLRARLKAAVGGHAYKKAESAKKLIGCSVSELKLHLESLFQEGMTWENHGLHGWHIDHSRPLSTFDLSSLEEQKKAFHYSNLHPLWAFDNLSKGNKILV